MDHKFRAAAAYSAQDMKTNSKQGTEMLLQGTAEENKGEVSVV